MARPGEPVKVAKLARFELEGEPLGRTLQAGAGPRRMRKDHKAKLLSTDVAKVLPQQIWDYAFLTARRPWIDNVARLAVVDASMRSTPDDFLLSASDGNYHLHATRRPVPEPAGARGGRADDHPVGRSRLPLQGS